MDSRKVFLTVITGATLASAALATEHVDPDNNDSQYAYGANIGWLNAEPGGDGGPGLDMSDKYVKGWLWSANVGWISLSCQNTDSCATVEYGVKFDGVTQFSGYAWSPNMGWISFSCEDSGSCGSVDYRVLFDSGSHRMYGFAYAANAGWISFSCKDTGICDTNEYGVLVDPLQPSNILFRDGFEAFTP